MPLKKEFISEMFGKNNFLKEIILSWSTIKNYEQWSSIPRIQRIAIVLNLTHFKGMLSLNLINVWIVHVYARFTQTYERNVYKY